MLSQPKASFFLTPLQPGEQALIIDAGGGTIDISTYRVLSNGPLQVEELYEPSCESGSSQGTFSSLITSTSGLVQGGELVTARATAMTQGMFWRCIHRLAA